MNKFININDKIILIINKLLMKIAFLLEPSSQLNNFQIEDCYIVDSEIIYVDDKNIENKISSINENNIVGILKHSKKIFTSMPSLGNVIEKIDSLLEKYDLVIGVCLSKYLSNTYQSWKNIENDYNNKFWAIDVDDIEIGLIWTVQYIKQNINKFKDKKNLQELLSIREKNILNYITLTNLDSLAKSGRISNFKSNIIKFFKIKIIIGLSKQKGKLDLVEKKFSYSGVIKFLTKKVNDIEKIRNLKIKRIAFLSTFENKKIEDKLIKKIEKKMGFSKVEYSKISLLVASHTGLNAFGFYLELGD